MNKLISVALLITGTASASMPRPPVSEPCIWASETALAKLEAAQQVVISELPNTTASYLMLNDVNNNALAAYKQMLYACEKELPYQDKMKLEERIEQHEDAQDEIAKRFSLYLINN